MQTAHSHDAQQVKVNTQTVLPAVDQRKPPRPCQIRTEHHPERDEHTTPLHLLTWKHHSVTERFRHIRIDAISLNFHQTPEQRRAIQKWIHRHAPLAHTDRCRTTDQIGPFPKIWGEEITQILPGYSIHHTERWDLILPPHHSTPDALKRTSPYKWIARN